MSEQFILKPFDDYPDPLHNENISLEDIFGITLAVIEKEDPEFAKEMIDIWNSKEVTGKRRLVWITIRHYQYLRMKMRETHTIWQQLKYGESLIALTKTISS
ncbi:MAG: hypothetical protein KJI71_01430 [Patescibacteria group bacterium]|nr:hypothetical protein [Patescibacteria group bacterium]